MSEMQIIYIVAGIIACLFLLAYSEKKKKKKKIRYIKQADEIIAKLKTFDGQHKEAQILTYLRKINPYVFEELLLTVLQKRGYRIERNKRYSHDGGIDGKFYDGENLFLIQAKRYTAHIDPKHLKEFQQKIFIHKAKGGLFIHTGKTGQTARNEYRDGQIKIISGQKLVELIVDE